jgi:hypothetical protein
MNPPPVELELKKICLPPDSSLSSDLRSGAGEEWGNGEAEGDTDPPPQDEVAGDDQEEDENESEKRSERVGEVESTSIRTKPQSRSGVRGSSGRRVGIQGSSSSGIWGDVDVRRVFNLDDFAKPWFVASRAKRFGLSVDRCTKECRSNEVDEEFEVYH